jgi:hypothetical protein
LETLSANSATFSIFGKIVSRADLLDHTVGL